MYIYIYIWVQAPPKELNSFSGGVRTLVVCVQRYHLEDLLALPAPAATSESQAGEFTTWVFFGGLGLWNKRCFWLCAFFESRGDLDGFGQY